MDSAPRNEQVPATEQAPNMPVAGVAGVGARPAARPGNARLLNLALIGAVVLAIGGIAFAAGRMTAPTLVGSFQGPNGQNFLGGPQGSVVPGQGGQLPVGGQGGPGAFLGNGGITIEGTVESISDTTLTLRTADGQTVQINLDGSTTYHAQSDASADDVTTGGTVQVRLNGGRIGGGNGGNGANGGGASASDVTVVP